MCPSPSLIYTDKTGEFLSQRQADAGLRLTGGQTNGYEGDSRLTVCSSLSSEGEQHGAGPVIT